MEPSNAPRSRSETKPAAADPGAGAAEGRMTVCSAERPAFVAPKPAAPVFPNNSWEA
jgi:hypothetical protein